MKNVDLGKPAHHKLREKWRCLDDHHVFILHVGPLPLVTILQLEQRAVIKCRTKAGNFASYLALGLAIVNSSLRRR